MNQTKLYAERIKNYLYQISLFIWITKSFGFSQKDIGFLHQESWLKISLIFGYKSFKEFMEFSLLWILD